MFEDEDEDDEDEDEEVLGLVGVVVVLLGVDVGAFVGVAVRVVLAGVVGVGALGIPTGGVTVEEFAGVGPLSAVGSELLDGKGMPGVEPPTLGRCMSRFATAAPLDRAANAPAAAAAAVVFES
jgi:hypothetical protein